ncbi:hypothetical protein GCM10010365_58190 [Streptomyces poonensis]|uniref:Secreted protein n=1 Tax=Streptomyces poonensis TaxID=68255 RepID=A0A918Q1K0_9ACTN|nr:hypothetical protein GCM10010365_58190 [Streptomyces poonensis]
MRVRNSTRKGARRATVALVAACVAGAVATPLAIAAASSGTSSAASSEDQAAGRSDLLLPVPGATRISDDPYMPFQMCASPAGDPVVADGAPTFAATLESVAPPGTVEPEQPGSRRKVTFELEKADGKPVLHQQLLSPSSHSFVYSPPARTLDDGAYRWRVQVKDGPRTSGWTDWCSFTVKGA